MKNTLRKASVGTTSRYGVQLTRARGAPVRTSVSAMVMTRIGVGGQGRHPTPFSLVRHAWPLRGVRRRTRRVRSAVEFVQFGALIGQDLLNILALNRDSPERVHVERDKLTGSRAQSHRQQRGTTIGRAGLRRYTVGDDLQTAGRRGLGGLGRDREECDALRSYDLRGWSSQVFDQPLSQIWIVSRLGDPQPDDHREERTALRSGGRGQDDKIVRALLECWEDAGNVIPRHPHFTQKQWLRHELIGERRRVRDAPQVPQVAPHLDGLSRLEALDLRSGE